MQTLRLAPIAVLLIALLLGIPAWGQDTPAVSFSPEQAKRWRSQIRETLFIPDTLPALEPQVHGAFEPIAGVVAERVTYSTRFGMRVPAILYRPKAPQGPAPALVIVNGHGGDKYSWYAFYSGLLYAQAGAVVLTYDPIGEGERNAQRKSGTRAHDQKLEPREMALLMGGSLVSDVMQAVSYVRTRPEVDPKRIGAAGYSLGSFLIAIAGALDDRLHYCILTGGGNLDRPGGYWDGTKPMCTGTPYQALLPLGDRPAVIYALHASRGPTLLLNGTADSVVGIPNHNHDEAFFKDLQSRTARLKGNAEGLFDFQLVPEVSHRPFFVTRAAALWLEDRVDLPNWTATTIRSMKETHISRWAIDQNVEMDRGYIAEDREGGTQALGQGIPGLTRANLSVFSADDWEQRKPEFIYESWVPKARAALESPAR
jgi:dienelactone hydrolase